jgi:hypothetical protein
MQNLVLIILTYCAFPVFGQSDFNGVWATGEDNTTIEISGSDGLITGKIKSSDNKKAKIGRVILKDLQKNGSKWTGRIYAAKRGEWHDVEIMPNGEVLKLKVTAGLFSKSLEWKKIK